MAVGVPDGIPADRAHFIDVTQSPYNADSSGATDAQPAIQEAVNAASPGDIVYLPAGTYRIDAPISIGYRKSDITIRGAGMETVIDCRTSTYGISVGTSFSFDWPKSGATLTPSTLTKGATTLPMSDTSAFSTGELAQIILGNDPSIPVVSVFGYDLRPSENQWRAGMRRQIVKIVNKTATTLTIFPGLYGDYTGAPNADVRTSQYYTSGIGVEDLVVDCNKGATTFAVGFNTCYGCWAKNVKVQYSSHYGIYISTSLMCEIRHCWIDQAKNQGSTSHCGFLVDTGTACLIEDNVVVHNFPSMMINQGSSGNVIAYNFCYDSTAYGVGGVSINSNHGPHNSFNLYEGNIAPNLQCDGYFGSASHDTIFRNWLHGMQPGISRAGWTVSLNRFTRYYALVANVLGNPTWPGEGVSLGNPNMGNGSHTGEAPPWSDAWVDGPGTLSQSGTEVSTTIPTFTPSSIYSFIYIPTAGASARIESYIDAQHVIVNASRTASNVNYIITPGPSGYQELDLGVAATLYRIGNFNYRDAAIPASESLGGTPIPASLFRNAKPSWFGELPWPAIDPLAPNPSYDAIPAGYRFVHGTDPTSVGANVPPQQQQPFNVRIWRQRQ